MIVIGRIIIFINDLEKIVSFKSGPNFKEALLHFFRHDKVRYKVLENLINDESSINVLVKNNKELELIFNLFTKFPLTGAQTIRLRTYSLSNKDILDIINLYNEDILLNKAIVKIDNLDWICLRKYKLFLEKFNAVISSIPDSASQLEIIKYAYDYTKSKEYKHVPCDEKSLISRNLTSAFLGEFIVCAGFTKIFNTILREFEIPCTEYHFQLKGQYGHSVSIVNINDPKYGINGLYFFDPTRDSYSPNENCNETKYKGFMQPLDAYMQSDLLIDSFHLMLENDSETLAELAKGVEEQEKRYVDIFRNKEFKEELETVFDTLDIDYDLFKDTPSFIGSTSNAMIEIPRLYEFYLKLRNSFGEDLNTKQFISLLDNTNCDYIFAVNATISRFTTPLEDEDIQLLGKIKRK